MADLSTMNFKSMPLNAPLQKALEVLKFTQATPVQSQSLPPLLEGKDVIAQARTGSGKTVAFGLGLLSQINVKAGQTQALVLCPTRELADQVSEEIRRLARFIPNTKVVTLCGGRPARTQMASLVRAPHIVVGTPGRVLDHFKRESLHAHALRVFVLDEADRMLDMGFSEDIAAIHAFLSKKKQTLLFSATFPGDIEKMSQRFQKDPVRITVDSESTQAHIDETFYRAHRDDKIDVVLSILAKHQPDSALIFCVTRADTRELASALKGRGVSVLALHGDMDQFERDEMFIRFANKSAQVLCATDVAARGLDVKKLDMVISYELAHDVDVHQHRVGRTGRAGESGLAFALVAPRESDRVRALEEKRGEKIRLHTPDLQREFNAMPAEMISVRIDAGKRDKIRAGDLLGALTGDMALDPKAIGKFNILPKHTYVAFRRGHIAAAMAALRKHKIKGRSFRATRLT